MPKSSVPLALITGKSSPALRSKRKNAARVEAEPPICPTELSERAKTEWRYITPLLAANGLLTKLDRAVLAEYCASYALWIEMQERISEKHGLTFSTESGFEQQIPEIGIMHKAAERMMKAGDKLGLSPSARSGINVNGGGGTDGEDLLD